MSEKIEAGLPAISYAVQRHEGGEWMGEWKDIIVFPTPKEAESMLRAYEQLQLQTIKYRVVKRTETLHLPTYEMKGVSR